MKKINKYYLTVGKLRDILKGLPDNMPIYTADHDHSEWETNGRASYAEVRNQKDMSDYAKECLERDKGIFKRKGKYFVIGV